MKKIAILGSTGSIGTQTLDVVRNYKKDFEIVSFAAGSNIELLEKQIREFRPKLVCVYKQEAAESLKENIKDTDTKVVSGMDGLMQAAVMEEAEIVVTAFVGMIGIKPTIEAIKAGKDIALANKETLVTAGHIIMPLAKERRVNILPVDSEHSAILQCLGQDSARCLNKCLNGGKKEAVSRLLITASGGPFRGRTKEEMKEITVEQALRHPNWSMGKKITIDSATMVNKGLEVIEAKWLFGMDFDDIQVVVQPQSLIHSMVEFADGAIMAQLGTPDMKLPIQYALFYPERRFLPGKRVDFTTLAGIDFGMPDMENFNGLALAYQAGREGGSMTTVFNAANEYAVQRFLNREISFLDITDSIRYAMEQHKNIENPSVEQILETERETDELLREAFMKKLIGGNR